MKGKTAFSRREGSLSPAKGGEGGGMPVWGPGPCREQLRPHRGQRPEDKAATRLARKGLLLLSGQDVVFSLWALIQLSGHVSGHGSLWRG